MDDWRPAPGGLEPEAAARWPARRALLLPTAAIVGAVIYLITSNPTARRAVGRDDVARPPLAIPTTEPTQPALAPTAIAPTSSAARGHNDTFRVQDPFGLESRPPPPGWHPGPELWNTTGIPWSPVLPMLSHDGPRIHFVERVGNTYRFLVDTLQPGETVERDHVTVAFDVAGAVFWPGRLTMSATPHSPAGLELAVTFDPGLAGMMGPALTLTVAGSGRSVASLRVPYVHAGARPEQAYRLSSQLANLFASVPFALLVPDDLPLDSLVQWAGYVPGGNNARGISWTVPGESGWMSLVAVESDRCLVSGAREAFDCFGPAVARTGEAQLMRLAGVDWLIAFDGAVWTAFGQARGTYVALTAPTRDLVVRAASSLVSP